MPKRGASKTTMLGQHTRGGPTVWVGQTLRGKYKIVRPLGEGGWGAVFEAEHLLLRRMVAIKILHPDMAANPKFAERFRREALAASRIGHPNIVEVIDLDRTDDGLEFMVLELLRGEVLERRIERLGALPIAAALDIFMPIASALEAAHRIGIIHRDLKPANIFLAERPDGSAVVKVLDFGIAKMDGTINDLSASLTQAGSVLGTPFYMPPEQLRGDKTIDRRADLYSFGVMLYEALAAAPPFDAPNLPALVTKIMYEPPVPLATRRPRVPPEIDALISRLMSKEADGRPADFGEVIAVLEAVRANLPAEAEEDLDGDEPTIVSTSSSMDEVLDELPTMVMQSPLSLPDMHGPTLRIAPELGEASRPQIEERGRSVGAGARSPVVKVLPKDPPARRVPLPHEPPKPSPERRGANEKLGADQMILMTIAFVAVGALTYWIVLSL